MRDSIWAEGCIGKRVFSQSFFLATTSREADVHVLLNPPTTAGKSVPPLAPHRLQQSARSSAAARGSAPAPRGRLPPLLCPAQEQAAGLTARIPTPGTQAGAGMRTISDACLIPRDGTAAVSVRVTNRGQEGRVWGAGSGPRADRPRRAGTKVTRGAAWAVIRVTATFTAVRRSA
jgi:hypothetical protein